jgi:hypothetical protein
MRRQQKFHVREYDGVYKGKKEKDNGWYKGTETNKKKIMFKHCNLTGGILFRDSLAEDRMIAEKLRYCQRTEFYDTRVWGWYW